MPQMMPMYWIAMTMMTIILLMIITNFFYFFMMFPPSMFKDNFTFKMNSSWIWKW